MKELLDKTLKYLGTYHPKNTFIINIGSMDGKLFDDLAGYTSIYQFRTLYVEPIPEMFNRLKNNITIPGSLFENSAITTYDGEIEMVTIETQAIDEKLVEQCFYGMSSVYPPKNGLSHEQEIVDKWGKRISVPCMTLQSLFNKFGIHGCDVFKIDAEGHDYEIFKQLDLVNIRPKLVRLEWVNLSDHEKFLVKSKFMENDYVYEIDDDHNIDAMTVDFVKQIKDDRLFN